MSALESNADNISHMKTFEGFAAIADKLKDQIYPPPGTGTVFVCMYVRMYVCMYMYVCMQICIHICVCIAFSCPKYI